MTKAKKKKKVKKVGRPVKAKAKVTKKARAKKPHVTKKRQPKIEARPVDPYDIFMDSSVTILLLNESLLVDVKINKVYPDVVRIIEETGPVYLVSKSAIMMCRLSTQSEQGAHFDSDEPADAVHIPDPNALVYEATKPSDCHA